MRRALFPVCFLMMFVLAGCGAPPDAGINQDTSLSVHPAMATLRVGDTLQLQATIFSAWTNETTTPKGSWSSSDPGIVKVDSSGMLFATAEGGATVTFLSSSGESAAATVGVTPKASSVTIAPKSATINSGSSFQFSATAVIDGKDQDVTNLADWSLDNSLFGLASVSNGLVEVSSGAVSTQTVIHITVSYAGFKAAAPVFVNP